MKHTTDALDAGWRRRPLGLRYAGQLLRRQYAFLLLVPLVSTILGVGYVIFATPIYMASALLSVDVASAPSEALSATLVSHIAGIQSSEVTSNVIDRLDLEEEVTVTIDNLDWAISAARRAFGIETVEEMSEEKLQALLIERVAAALAVERVGDSTIIRVSYFSARPRRAAEVANTYVDAYVEGLVDRSLKNTERRADFLRSRVAETKQLAASSYQEVQQIRSQDGFELQDFEDLDARVAWLREVRSEIEEAEIAIKARLSLMEDIQNLDSLEIAAFQAENGSDLYFAYKEALANLIQLRERDAAPNYVSQHEASVKQLRRNLDQAIRQKRRGLGQELAILSARRKSIDQEFGDDLSESNVLNWSKIQIAEHQAGVFQNIYADHLRELEVVYGKAGEVPVRVMAHARPSIEPSSPDYELILVLSAMMGFAVGGSIAMLREWQASHAPYHIGYSEELGPEDA